MKPDLSALLSATETVGRALKRGGIVVYEPTVYPGMTEETCAPLLEKISGLRFGIDFQVGYSPERINPGDPEHTLQRVKKVVAGSDGPTTERLARLYASIVPAGIHVAPSIKVAEAAKVIENTQRDLNIALMNELALICDRLQIRTADVLEAAGTKWNFLPFKPGLVGGHCIGVDPYYLTNKAEMLGYTPEVILAGRRINDRMGRFVAQRLKSFLEARSKPLDEMHVAILGLTFKEDVPDVRNSRVPDMVDELHGFGIRTSIADPHASPVQAMKEFGLGLTELSEIGPADALVLAVPHAEFLRELEKIWKSLMPQGIFIDVKSVVDPSTVPDGTTYWSL